MNGFLTFLSNNYLYFLIAAGVLFFALLGFLVDLKRKKESLDNIVDETPVPEVNTVSNNEPLTEPVEEVSNIDSNAIVDNLETANPMPPMPSEPVDATYPEQPYMNNVNNGINELAPSNSAEVLNVQQPVGDVIPEPFGPDQANNQTQNLEEFK